jgi:hypothetical protein
MLQILYFENQIGIMYEYSRELINLFLFFNKILHV